MSQITKTKRLGRSDSIYLSSYTEPIRSDSSSTETSFTSSFCGWYPARLFGACISRSAKQNRSNICLVCRGKEDKNVYALRYLVHISWWRSHGYVNLRYLKSSQVKFPKNAEKLFKHRYGTQVLQELQQTQKQFSVTSCSLFDVTNYCSPWNF